MAFQTIRTSYGLAKLAAAAVSNIPINLTQIAVGDGNGNPVAPSLGQTNLVRERYRAAPNRVYQHPTDPTQYIAELVIPIASAGFTLREIGAFDADGGLIAVGNLPDAYLPLLAEGSFTDAIVRMIIKAGNAGVITLQVDTAVALASQAWVLANVNTCLLLPGGTTGQVLRKASNGCGDTEWADPTDVSVTVNSIEETQTLAAAQTVVDWATVTNDGLAVYIEGVRLRADQWTPHPTIGTRITLATSYPAGTKITGAQNEPAGAAIEPLAKNQNLADVPNKATARTNLDVHSRAESNAAGQPGDIKYTGRSTAPTGWLKANGAAVSRTTYADLFAAIGTTFGAGDGINTFNLPDLRGEFIRGWDDGRGVDAGRAFGSAQADEIKSHTHITPIYDPDEGVNNEVGGARAEGGVNNKATQATGGTETRPRNVALLACIKF